MPQIPVQDTPRGTSFSVRVAPRASRTAILGIVGEGDKMALKIALQAPPIEGRANAALMEFLSKLLKTPRAAIEIAGGERGRNKRILVHGRGAAEVAALIEQALATRTHG